MSFADTFVTAAPDLDILGDDTWRGTVSLRWVLVHLIEEYARHNGHADLLRERIDGAIGLWARAPADCHFLALRMSFSDSSRTPFARLNQSAITATSSAV